MGLPFGGLGASLDFARVFYSSDSRNVSRNHFDTSGAAEHPFQQIMFFFFSDAIWVPRCLLIGIVGFHSAPQEHLGRPFWHLGSTLGSHFGVSEAPWEAILATRDHPGGPWEQQDGHKVARHRILVDFGMISGRVLG